jgi:hypothetical protein
VSARRFPPLRRRLFFAIVIIVVVSIGVTFAVGVALSRRAVERANLDDLAHQADLIAQRENESDVLLPLSRLERLQPFLEKQDQRIEIVDLKQPSTYLEGEHLADVRARRPAGGTITVDGETYLFAARNVQGRGFVLLRPKTLSFADWQPFLLALLIAGAIAAGLAAIGSFLTPSHGRCVEWRRRAAAWPRAFLPIPFPSKARPSWRCSRPRSTRCPSSCRRRRRRSATSCFP